MAGHTCCGDHPSPGPLGRIPLFRAGSPSLSVPLAQDRWPCPQGAPRPPSSPGKRLGAQGGSRPALTPIPGHLEHHLSPGVHALVQGSDSSRHPAEGVGTPRSEAGEARAAANSFTPNDASNSAGPDPSNSGDSRDLGTPEQVTAFETEGKSEVSPRVIGEARTPSSECLEHRAGSAQPPAGPRLLPSAPAPAPRLRGSGVGAGTWVGQGTDGLFEPGRAVHRGRSPR